MFGVRQQRVEIGRLSAEVGDVTAEVLPLLFPERFGKPRQFTAFGQGIEQSHEPRHQRASRLLHKGDRLFPVRPLRQAHHAHGIVADPPGPAGQIPELAGRHAHGAVQPRQTLRCQEYGRNGKVDPLGNRGRGAQDLQLAAFGKPFHERSGFIRQTRVMHADAMVEHGNEFEVFRDFSPQKILHQEDLRIILAGLGKGALQEPRHLPHRADIVGDRDACAAAAQNRCHCRSLHAQATLDALRKNFSSRHWQGTNASHAVRSSETQGLRRGSQRLELEMPTGPDRFIGHRSVEPDDPLVGLPSRRRQTDRRRRVGLLREPSGDIVRGLDERHQEQEVRFRTVPFDRRQEELDSEAPTLRLQVVRLIDHQQGQSPFDPLVADRERQLLRRSDEDIEGVRFGSQEVVLKDIHFHRRTQLLHANSDRPEVPPQPTRDLAAQSAGGSHVRNPAAGVTELVKRLENAELRQERLAAGRRHVDHDRGLGWIQESLLQQRCALRGQEFKHWLMLAPRQCTHEVRGLRIHPSQD